MANDISNKDSYARLNSVLPDPRTPEEIATRRAQIAEEAEALSALLHDVLAFHAGVGKRATLDGAISGVLTFALQFFATVLEHHAIDPQMFAFHQMSILEALTGVIQQLAAIQPTTGGEGRAN